MADGDFSPLAWHRAVISERCTLDPYESLVMLALVKFADEHGKAFPGMGTLAKVTRISRRKVVHALAALELRGLLARHAQTKGKGFGSNTYRLPPEPSLSALGATVSPSAPDALGTADTSAPDAPGSAPHALEVVHHLHQGSAPDAPYLLTDLPNVSAQGTAARVAGTKKAGAGKLKDDALKVFEAWKLETDHPKAELDQKRETRIVARLNEGFSTEQLIAAVKNRRHDPFLMGDNRSGRLFDGVETLLRDRAQVERLLELTVPMKSKRTTSDFHAPTLATAELDEAEVARREASRKGAEARAEAQRDARDAELRRLADAQVRALGGAS